MKKSGMEILRSGRSLTVVAGIKTRMTTQNQQSRTQFYLKNEPILLL